MNYDDANYDAMQEEYAFQQAMQDEDYDIMQEEAYRESLKGEIVANPMLALMTSENWERYEFLVTLMENKQLLNLSIGLDNGVPYYQTEIYGIKRKIYITKEMRRQIYNYLTKGIIPAEMPKEDDVFNVYNKMDESFILYHFRADKNRGAICYNPETKEYHARYEHGIINYGQLPYTPDELVAKLNSLQ